MAEPKTRPTTASVEDFLVNLKNPEQQADSRTLVGLMSAATGAEPILWGANIVGFGTASMRYANGSRLDWPALSFSPRKQTLVVYLMDGVAAHPGLLARLGPHKTGKGCLYIKRLAEVDLSVLEEILRRSAAARQEP